MLRNVDDRSEGFTTTLCEGRQERRGKILGYGLYSNPLKEEGYDMQFRSPGRGGDYPLLLRSGFSSCQNFVQKMAQSSIFS